MTTKINFLVKDYNMYDDESKFHRYRLYNLQRQKINFLAIDYTTYNDKSKFPRYSKYNLQRQK